MANILQHMKTEVLVLAHMDNYEQLRDLETETQDYVLECMHDPEYLKLAYKLYLDNGIQVLELPSALDFDPELEGEDEFANLITFQSRLIDELRELCPQHLVIPFYFALHNKHHDERFSWYRKQFELALSKRADALVLHNPPSLDELELVLDAYEALCAEALPSRYGEESTEEDFPALFFSAQFKLLNQAESRSLCYAELEFSVYLERYAARIDAWGVEGLGTQESLEALAHMRSCAASQGLDELVLAVQPCLGSDLPLASISCLNEFESFVVKALAYQPSLIMQGKGVGLADMVSAILIFNEYQLLQNQAENTV